jgi:hypothetical protein
MKNYKIILSILLLFISISIVNGQQTPFTGTVVYEITAIGNIPEQLKAMMPTEMTLRFSATKESMGMNFPIMDQKTIYDLTKKDATLLIDLMGQKLMTKKNAAQLEEIRKIDGESMGVKITKDVAVFAGERCKKAIITKKLKNGRLININVYYAEKYDVSRFNYANTFPEVKGLPLLFNMKNGGFNLTLRARSVKKEDIPASEFVISHDYKPMTKEGIQKMMGSMGHE